MCRVTEGAPRLSLNPPSKGSTSDSHSGLPHGLSIEAIWVHACSRDARTASNSRTVVAKLHKPTHEFHNN
jgi:hypothetical protein